jgi:aspartate beta-hydroxylase
VQAVKPGESIESLMTAASRALAAGDAPAARDILEAAVARDAGHVPAWLNLAAAARAMSDPAGALAALEGALRAEPRNFLALLGKASLLERQGQAKPAAVAYGVAASQAPPLERLDPGTRRALEHGRELHARHQAELEAFIRDTVGPALHADARTARRAGAFIDVTLRKRPNYRQDPVEFFWPGLPAIEFYERGLFPWMADFEAATGVIREELLALLREDADGLTPYVSYPDGLPLDQWAELNRSPRWSAFHLLLQGAPVEANCRRAPRTMEAIGLLPQPNVPGRSPAAMFSVLQPKTRIPPHTGIANTRLVVHLPLVVPPDCGFRVGSETRPWREGEAWVFDDTIEHEAWNGSDQWRTILICDVWSPLLSEQDREIVTQVMVAMDAFNGAAPQDSL